MPTLPGVLAPVITPFTAGLAPDAARWIAHCRWLAEQDVGLAVFGTNSEGNSLSVGEKAELLGRLFEAGIDPGIVMPGTGCCALSDTVTLTRHALDLGCRQVLMLPPFYYKDVSDEGFFRSYAEIIERIGSSDLRIYLYHIPPVARVDLSVALVERLVRAFPGVIAGIKDSSGDFDHTRTLIERGGEGFQVFSGSESFLLRNLEAGGAGCISATANINPAAIRRLYDRWRTPDAPRLQQDLDQVRGIVQMPAMIAALKGVVAHWSNDPQWERLRPPLTPLADDRKRALLAALQVLEFDMPGLPRN